MPLVWAHAEYVKLRRSLHDGRVFDTPRHTVERYLEQDTHSRCAAWRFEQKRRAMAEGKILRIEVRSPAVVHWSMNDWAAPQDTETRDTRLGLHFADLPTQDATAGSSIVFTFYWPDSERWEGTDFRVVIEKQRAEPAAARKVTRRKPTRVDDHRTEPTHA
jgi:glucoamylase